MPRSNSLPDVEFPIPPQNRVIREGQRPTYPQLPPDEKDEGMGAVAFVVIFGLGWIMGVVSTWYWTFLYNSLTGGN